MIKDTIDKLMVARKACEEARDAVYAEFPKDGIIGAELQGSIASIDSTIGEVFVKLHENGLVNFSDPPEPVKTGKPNWSGDHEHMDSAIAPPDGEQQ